MTRLYVAVAAAWIALRLAMAERRRDQAGLATLEIVVIALGLLVLATGAVAVFQLAVTSRTDQLK